MEPQTILMPEMSTAEAPKSFWQKWGLGIIIGLIVLALLFALYWFNLLPFNLISKYQAVFLANGQVYFGKISGEKGDYMKLASIYYLQVQQPVQPAEKTTSQPNLQLVKLGSELHGPEDTMYIAKNQILFYEDLKNDSQVVQAIKKFEKK